MGVGYFLRREGHGRGGSFEVTPERERLYSICLLLVCLWGLDCPRPVP